MLGWPAFPAASSNLHLVPGARVGHEISASGIIVLLKNNNNNHQILLITGDFLFFFSSLMRILVMLDLHGI